MLSFARRLRCVPMVTAVALCTLTLAAALPGQIGVLSNGQFLGETGERTLSGHLFRALSAL